MGSLFCCRGNRITDVSDLGPSAPAGWRDRRLSVFESAEIVLTSQTIPPIWIPLPAVCLSID